ncbi:MAG: cob(I)yrinic acid a,c-diamide adenosyltransferase [Flavobacteriaceae bacterium]
MKIYTKTGDSGTTALFGGTRVEKHNLFVEAYGTVDELNAHIGLLRDHIEDTQQNNALISIQNTLFEIGAHLASGPKNSQKNQSKLPEIKKSAVAFLESEIDDMNTKLSPMTHFILPGGHPIVSYCHIARCVCRRAERRVSQVSEHQKINPDILVYLNRLSDYLFVCARVQSKRFKADEIKWIPSKNS